MGQRRGRSRYRERGRAGRGRTPGRVGEAGLEAQAHHHLLPVGWRRARTARIDGMGRGARCRAESACRGLHQFRFELPWISVSVLDRTRWSMVVNDVEREMQRSREEHVVWRRAQMRRIARARKAGRAPELRDRAELRIGALGDGSRLRSIPRPCRSGRAEPGLRRRGSRRRLSLHLRRLLLVHPLRRSQLPL